MRISQTGLIPSSFQRVLLEALRDPGLNWIPRPGGNGVGLGSLFGDNVFVNFTGKDFTLDTDFSPLTGIITRIEISGGNDPEPESVATNMKIDWTELLAATEGEWTGFGGPDYNKFSDTVMEDFNRLDGSSGRDVLETGNGRDIVRAGSGWDVIILAGWDGAQSLPDRLFGGGGRRDLLVVEDAPGALRIDLERGWVAERTDGPPTILARLAGIENVRGTEFGDFILGDESDNRLWGLRGHDLINAGGGDDRVFGGRGNDTLRGDSGNDIIDGYGGFDDIDGGTGHDILTGGNQGDTFIFDARPGAPFQGDDIITDYGNGSDSILIHGGPVVGMTVIAGNGLTLIDYGNGTITLEGVELTIDQINFEY